MKTNEFSLRHFLNSWLHKKKIKKKVPAVNSYPEGFVVLLQQTLILAEI